MDLKEVVERVWSEALLALLPKHRDTNKRDMGSQKQFSETQMASPGLSYTSDSSSTSNDGLGTSNTSSSQIKRRRRVPSKQDRIMSTSSGSPESWISSFCSLLGHEYFAEISEDFIEDDFNLTGLQTQVSMYKEALEVSRVGAQSCATC